MTMRFCVLDAPALRCRWPGLFFELDNWVWWLVDLTLLPCCFATDVIIKVISTYWNQNTQLMIPLEAGAPVLCTVRWSTVPGQVRWDMNWVCQRTCTCLLHLCRAVGLSTRLAGADCSLWAAGLAGAKGGSRRHRGGAWWKAGMVSKSSKNNIKTGSMCTSTCTYRCMSCLACTEVCAFCVSVFFLNVRVRPISKRHFQLKRKTGDTMPMTWIILLASLFGGLLRNILNVGFYKQTYDICFVYTSNQVLDQSFILN